MDVLSNWRSPAHPGPKCPEKGRLYNRTNGKSTEGVRVAEESVVVMKRSNVRGAKGLYCLYRFQQHLEAVVV